MSDNLVRKVTRVTIGRKIYFINSLDVEFCKSFVQMLEERQ